MKKTYFLKALLFVSCGLLGASCTKVDRAGIDPTPEARANLAIDKSFGKLDLAKEKQVEPKSDVAHVVIQKSALGKEFLLTVNMLDQIPTPMFQSLQSKVVSFLLRDGKVYLQESNVGHSVGENNIQQNLLLAEFPILDETTDFAVIDFNAGMKQIYTNGDMFASDDPVTTPDTEQAIANVRFSYLDQVSIDENQFFIRQIAQIEKATGATNTVSTVETRYYLAPYSPDSSFVPVRSPGFDKVGYFEANPLILPDGSKRIYSMKWNEKKPIQFAISANTPKEFRELIKNAVLYWNKILGENRVQVTQLEDLTITAPNPKYNIIQWADWDSAGYAYADAHLDPRSGEVLHAQVFFPSAFVRTFVERRFRLYEGSQPINPSVGLKGFHSSRFCARDLNRDLFNAQLPPHVSAEAMDKAMRDYVYEVIAHEVGHLMGLRHNFAGNLVANYDASERKSLVLDYYKNMKAPEGILDSSSVMEYSRFEESSWNGDLLQKANSEALSYDQMAMKYLYFGEKLPEKRPPFCTDSQKEKFVDCNMSDAGQSIFSFSHDWYQFSLQSLAAKTFNTYVSKTKLPENMADQAVSVSEVLLDPKAQAKTIATDFYKLLSLFKTGSKFIKVRSELMPQNPIFEESFVQKEREYLTAETDRLGGVKKLLAPIPDDLDTQLQLQFNKMVDDPEISTGATVGQHFAFSDAEKKTMKDNFALFSQQFKKQLILRDLAALSGDQMSFEASYGQPVLPEAPLWLAHQATKELAKVALDRFSHYAFSKTEKVLKVDLNLANGFQKTVELPVYLFDQKVRVASAKVFSGGHESLDWAFFETKKAKGLMKEQLSILGNVDDYDMSSFSPEVLNWYLENNQVQDQL